jgi:hypothetical protein
VRQDVERPKPLPRLGPFYGPRPVSRAECRGLATFHVVRIPSLAPFFTYEAPKTGDFCYTFLTPWFRTFEVAVT